MSSKAAKESKLEKLHNDLAVALSDEVNSGDCTAATYNVARQFLKDNSIECDPDSLTDGMVNLKKAASEIDEDVLPSFESNQRH